MKNIAWKELKKDLGAGQPETRKNGGGLPEKRKSGRVKLPGESVSN
jgi:hypothetical protein